MTTTVPQSPNKTLFGDRESYWDAIQAKLEQYDIKPRSNAVLAQELVLGASPEHFRPGTDRDDPLAFGSFDERITEKFAKDSVDWLKKKYGSRLISAELHTDERTPHIHAIVMPLQKKKLKKRRTKEQIANNEPAETYTAYRLDADTVFGKKQHQRLQSEFAKAVGLKAGIKNTKAKHKDQHEFYKAAQNAMRPQRVHSEKNDDDFPKLPKPDFLESRKSYAERVKAVYEEELENHRKMIKEQVQELQVERRALAERNKQLKAENEAQRQKLGVLADAKMTAEELGNITKKYAEEQAQKLDETPKRKSKGLNMKDLSHQ